MTKPIESYVFYESFYKSIEQLDTIEQRYEMFRIITEYALYGTTPNLQSINRDQRIIFLMAQPIINSNAKKRAGGAKGGRPKAAPQSAVSPIYIPQDEITALQAIQSQREQLR